MKSIVVTEFGSSDVLEARETETPEPDPGEVRIEVAAAGLNFADVMQRRGHYRGGPEPPFVPGMEAAGTVDAVGDDVDREVGDRVVALADGAYAEYVTAPEASLFDVPESMSFAEAAGFPVQFLTAHNCLHNWGDLTAHDRVLVHAAAGGVGTAAVQLADHAGAESFGTASTEEKLELASDLGLDHGVNYEEADFRETVDAETDGEGVDLVLDGVNGETFDRSLDALASFGRIVVYGAASGDVARPETTDLLFENKSVLGFHLGNAIEEGPSRVLGAVSDLQRLLAEGELEVVVGETFPLEDAAEAQEYLETRRSVGKVVLEP
ncbi:zn-dependent oxidoreductase, NADph:quinone reductase [Halogeometricum pallidum JCM 14848]|uniref:Zn-dependent oxidoreductase, NADph:quinone reductase n=1 Tax=Halogeometricum pallidum JCM 14848 TaxID=1227487 RepID=M0CXY3_HALPD|nr:NADPH:quinone oxidoreductase family protein [Halogeometricum pallidum]ELZ26754.1 zn-dependent oxidoreductase, NADph:quinone reductase [Halogeometricum pallidum JCM 14848]